MHNMSLKSIWQHYKLNAQGKSAVSRFVIMTFAVVAIALEWMARKLHITYNEINVIAYYWLIPVSWTLLLDYKLDVKIDLLGYQCYFLNRWGGNYVLNSVVICAVIPLIIYIFLLVM